MKKPQDNEQKRRVSLPSDFAPKDLLEVPFKIWVWLFGIALFLITTAYSAGYTVKIQHSNDSIAYKVLEEKQSLQKKDTTSNEPQSNTETSTDTALSNLRKEHQVKQITNLQNELGLDQLPKGVYGYIYPHSIGYYLTKKYSPVLYREFSHTKFEIHLMPDGQQLVVGYVSNTDQLKLDDKTLRKAEIAFFNIPMEGTILTSLNLKQIKGFDGRDMGKNKNPGTIADVTISSKN